jgi:hypothetical protein
MTIFTVGYGDITPHTLIGKILAILSALWGAFLTSFAVVTVTNIFNLNKSQLQAHTHLKYAESAAKTISVSFKYFLAKKKYYVQVIKYNPTAIINSDFLRQALKQRDIKNYKNKPNLKTIILK